MFRRFAVAAAAALIVAMPAQAQTCAAVATCSLTPTASLQIQKLVRLQVSSMTIALTAPDSLAGQNEVTDLTGAFTVKANTGWALTVFSPDADFTYVGTASGARPRGDLEFQANCTGTWSALTGSGQSVASNASATNGTAAGVCLRMNFPADYASVKNRPGTYTLPVTFNLTAP